MLTQEVKHVPPISELARLENLLGGVISYNILRQNSLVFSNGKLSTKKLIAMHYSFELDNSTLTAFRQLTSLVWQWRYLITRARKRAG